MATRNSGKSGAGRNGGSSRGTPPVTQEVESPQPPLASAGSASAEIDEVLAALLETEASGVETPVQPPASWFGGNVVRPAQKWCSRSHRKSAAAPLATTGYLHPAQRPLPRQALWRSFSRRLPSTAPISSPGSPITRVHGAGQEGDISGPSAVSFLTTRDERHQAVGLCA
jgi:hypothetical protein